MKRIYTILALLFFNALFLIGQEYHPFLKDSARWNVLLVSTCDDMVPPDTTLLRYVLGEEYIKDSTLYQTLHLESGDFENPERIEIGAFREQDKKVYYIGEDILGLNYFDGEWLLYDFSATVGDTIKHGEEGYWYSIVLDIDSIQIGDVYRKRFKVHNNSFFHNPDYIIEGVGSVLNGLLGHISSIPTCGFHFWEHICYYENDSIRYINPNYSSCYPDYLIASVVMESANSMISVYPNPATSQINIVGSELQSVEIYGVNGELLKKVPCLDRNATIDVSFLKSGIYFLNIYTVDGVQIEKIVVE